MQPYHWVFVDTSHLLDWQILSSFPALNVLQLYNTSSVAYKCTWQQLLVILRKSSTLLFYHKCLLAHQFLLHGFVKHLWLRGRKFELFLSNAHFFKIEKVNWWHPRQFQVFFSLHFHAHRHCKWSLVIENISKHFKLRLSVLLIWITRLIYLSWLIPATVTSEQCVQICTRYQRAILQTLLVLLLYYIIEGTFLFLHRFMSSWLVLIRKNRAYLHID